MIGERVDGDIFGEDDGEFTGDALFDVDGSVAGVSREFCNRPSGNVCDRRGLISVPNDVSEGREICREAGGGGATSLAVI